MRRWHGPLWWRLFVVFLLLLMLGCAHTVDVPLDRVMRTEGERDGKHRIRMVDGTEYTTSLFAVSDSTLVIKFLDPSDPRFKTTTAPIVLPMRDVKWVGEVKSDWEIDVLVFVGAIALMYAVFFYLFAQGMEGLAGE